MATLIFDTFKFAKRLKEANFNEDQAETIAEAFKEVQELNRTSLYKDQESPDWGEAI